MAFDFARRLLDWYDRHGRKDLPWQQEPTPYRVWVSEIMLQQTQVATVIPYYQRFMARLPDIVSLAAAGEDEVLALWSGLGYYSRARNLHRAARQVVEEHGGTFPESLDGLTVLPGIGRSTAAAVLSLARGRCEPILDGNVKRVLSRFHAVEGWPGRSTVQKRLWALAEEHMPAERCAAYTQAIMDLGATLCSRGRPECERCPLNGGCRALAEGEPSRYPQPKPRKTLPERQTVMLIVRDEAGRVLLEKRPPSGIWGGLWSLPECGVGQEPAWFLDTLGVASAEMEPLPDFHHTFSHFRLYIQPKAITLDSAVMARVADSSLSWFAGHELESVGLPAPARRLLIPTS